MLRTGKTCRHSKEYISWLASALILLPNLFYTNNYCWWWWKGALWCRGYSHTSWKYSRHNVLFTFTLCCPLQLQHWGAFIQSEWGSNVFWRRCCWLRQVVSLIPALRSLFFESAVESSSWIINSRWIFSWPPAKHKWIFYNFCLTLPKWPHRTNQDNHTDKIS